MTRGPSSVAAVDASNQGQALWGGIVARAHAGAVRDSIMDPDRLNAGWGVRTLSQAAAAYNPFDYQTGAVWPHDSAMVAVGLRSYGFDDEALEIFTGLYEAATRFDLYRLPELFAGFDRADVWPTRAVSRGVQPPGLGRGEPAVSPDLSPRDRP